MPRWTRWAGQAPGAPAPHAPKPNPGRDPWRRAHAATHAGQVAGAPLPPWQVNAARVAQYIAEQRDAQYLVVSHKPQVYECAGCLVGVYSRQGGSAAVTLHLGAGASG